MKQAKGSAKPTGWKIAARISLVYAVVAGIWIYASDALVAQVIDYPYHLTMLQTYKGWFFVAATALLLYGLIGTFLTTTPQRVSRSDPASPSYSAWRSTFTPLSIFILLAGVIAGLGYLVYSQQKQALYHEKEQKLLTLANERAVEISHWLTERRNDGELIAHDPFVALAVKRWLDEEEPTEKNALHLQTWLANLQQRFDYSAAMLLDTRGRVLLDAGASSLHPEQQTLAIQAIANKQVLLSDLHWQAIDNRIVMDLIVPLGLGTSTVTPQTSALILQIDPAEYLFPLVQYGLQSNSSLETILVRQEGDSLLYLSELRHYPNAPLRLRFPADERLLEATSVSAEQTRLLQGLDYRRVEVLAAVLPIPTTDWLLITKIDTDEVYAPLRTPILQVVIVTVVVITGAGAGIGLWWRQQQARFSADHAQQELERQALVQRFEYLVRDANDIILLMDPKGQLLEANAKAVSTYGYTYSELLRLNIRDLRAPETQPQIADQMAQSSRSDGLLFETVHQRKDGSRFPVEVSSRRIELAETPFLQSIIRDITERKQAERALQFYRFLIDTIRDPVYVINPAQRFRLVQINKAGCQHFGRTEEELLTTSIPDWNPLFTWKVCEQFWEQLKSEQFILFETRHRLKDGRVVPVEVSANYLVYDQQEYIAGFFHDISRRKQVEEDLRESEERFRATFEQAAVGIAHLTTDGRFIRVNQKFCHILDYTQAELLECTFQDLTYAEDLQTDLDHLQRLLSDEVDAYSLEKRYIRKDGSLVWATLTVSLIHESSGKPKYFIAVIEDISQRKTTEAHLRQAQKMETMGQLTGGIAHDFNNLLGIILGNLDLLTETLQEPDSQNLVQRALDATERGAALVRRLLMFSRRQPLQAQPVDLNKLVLDMTDMLQRSLGETIQVETRLAEKLDQVVTDPSQFETALLNLALNARDAMPGGGKLIIETADVWLDQAYVAVHQSIQPGHYLLLTVSDTGTGMTPEALEHAFEPFYTTKEAGKGTGLGLSMVYGLVKQSEGYIQLYSEIGQGTTIKIYLPMRKTETDASLPPSPHETPTHPGRGEKILVVEDDPSLRQIAVTVLHELGYRTVAAETAAQALDLLKTHRETVLLFTDVVLPGGMSGVELAQEARQQRPDLKVLFTSGYTQSRFASSRQEENTAWLGKPYRKAQLAENLYAMLSDHFSAS